MDIPPTSFDAQVKMFRRAIKHDWNKAGKLFSAAWEQKDYTSLGVKGGACAIGCVLMADGVYQFVKGVGERVPNPEKPSQDEANWTRMYVGAMTGFFGAAALYIGAIANVAKMRSHMVR